MNPFEASLHLKGRRKEKAYFQHLLTTRQMAHAWLITGAKGSGKMTFCLAIARLLLGGQDGTQDRGRHITQNTDNDLLVITRTYDEKRKRYKDDIPVSSIRSVNHFLHRTTAHGGWRVVIIEDADLMNNNAANALLKILEEPPPKTAFFLTSPSTTKLLPTIRSRCRHLSLPPLGEEALREIVQLAAPSKSDIVHDEQAWQSALKKSKGRPGLLLEVINEDETQLANLIETVFDHPREEQKLALIDKILTLTGGVDMFFLHLLGALEERGRIGAQQGNTDIRKIPQIWSRVLDIYNKTNIYNLEKQQALIEAISLASLL